MINFTGISSKDFVKFKNEVWVVDRLLPDERYKEMSFRVKSLKGELFLVAHQDDVTKITREDFPEYWL